MKGHETDEIDVRPIFRIAVIFIVMGALIFLGVWWMFIYNRTQLERRDVRQTLIDAPPQLPPEPRLEVSPEQDWQAYRQSQEKILNTYGWVSREQGRVRIPIDRAMELVAQRGGL
jgi:hypothetical protein